MREPLIELRLWRQFLTVAETLHFGRAAARLHMTQPPLTQGIAQLERLLGVRLFDRTKRSVQLTQAGTALVPQVQAFLARAQALPPLARAASQGEAGHLRLAFVSTAGFTFLPGWVRAFRDAHPGVAFELVEATWDVQLPAFERGEIDAGFLLHSPGFAAAGLEQLVVAREPLVLALPEAHPLATARILALKKVLAEPLVLFPRRILPSLHDALFGLYHATGIEPPVAQEAIQMQTIVNLVSAGLGIAWVPQSVREFQRRGVVYRNAPVGWQVPVAETSLAWRAPATPSLQRFIEFAKARA